MCVNPFGRWFGSNISDLSKRERNEKGYITSFYIDFSILYDVVSTKKQHFTSNYKIPENALPIPVLLRHRQQHNTMFYLDSNKLINSSWFSLFISLLLLQNKIFRLHEHVRSCICKVLCHFSSKKGILNP